MRLLVLQEILQLLAIVIVEYFVKHRALSSKLFKYDYVLSNLQMVAPFEEFDIIYKWKTQPIFQIISEDCINRQKFFEHFIYLIDNLWILSKDFDLVFLIWCNRLPHNSFGKRINNASFEHILGQFPIKSFEKVRELSRLAVVHDSHHQVQILSYVSYS